jgi:galactokinase
MRNKELVKEVKACFQNQYKEQPIMVFSPGRINLIGEHTDYNDGFVFPAAIDLGIALAISKSSSNLSRVYALNKEEMHNIDLKNITPIKNGGWRNYVLGVIVELAKIGKFVGNFDSVFAGNIPGGAGMSSSAALENSFVFGLNHLFNLGLKKKEMILVSQKAEHHFVGVKCGIMDQYASMFGKKNTALLLDCRTLTSKKIKLKLKNLKLVLVNTNVKHELSESAYNDRRIVCEKISKLLNIKALRDASVNDLEILRDQISKTDFNKALYVIKENNRVQLFSDAILKRDYETMGELMYETHKGLSTNYNVSCKELDFLVDETKKMDFVFGSRMMGGGFGGCTISLVLEHEIKNFKHTISLMYQNKFGRDCSIYDVKISKGTQLILL